MKKLAEQLGKIDIQLSKWTRNLLYEHLLEICEDFKDQNKKFSILTVKSKV